MADTDSEMFKSVVEAGQTALKSALLINGGAATAVLAVMVEGLKTPSPLTGLLSPIAWCWLAFMLGLGAAASATAFRYLSQDRYAQQALYSNNPTAGGAGDRWKAWSIGTAVASFVLFFVGAIGIFIVVKIY